MPLTPGLPAHADIALLSVGVDVYEAEERLDLDSFLLSARGGRPRARDVVERTVELGYLGQSYSLKVAQISPHRYRIVVDSGEGDTAAVEVSVERLSTYESRLTLGDDRHRVVTIEGPSYFRVEVDSVSHKVTRDEGGMVRSPAPAVVVAIEAAAGTEVEAGQTILVLESMKMETHIKAPYAGRVREVLATVNGQVEAGGPLLRIDKLETGDAKKRPPRHGSTSAHRRSPTTSHRPSPSSSSRCCRACSPGTTCRPARPGPRCRSTTPRWPSSATTPTCGTASSSC